MEVSEKTQERTSTDVGKVLFIEAHAGWSWVHVAIHPTYATWGHVRWQSWECLSYPGAYSIPAEDSMPTQVELSRQRMVRASHHHSKPTWGQAHGIAVKMPTHHIRGTGLEFCWWIPFLASYLYIPCKVADDGTSDWVSATPVRDLDYILRSWF